MAFVWKERQTRKRGGKGSGGKRRERNTASLPPAWVSPPPPPASPGLMYPLPPFPPAPPEHPMDPPPPPPTTSPPPSPPGEIEPPLPPPSVRPRQLMGPAGQAPHWPPVLSGVIENWGPDFGIVRLYDSRRFVKVFSCRSGEWPRIGSPVRVMLHPMCGGPTPPYGAVWWLAEDERLGQIGHDMLLRGRGAQVPFETAELQALVEGAMEGPE
eukprot:Hpha_TRINITY_DN957_c0_g1::TRINITY_DN957_c0_g1_i1::g.156297::m.156297